MLELPRELLARAALQEQDPVAVRHAGELPDVGFGPGQVGNFAGMSNVQPPANVTAPVLNALLFPT